LSSGVGIVLKNPIILSGAGYPKISLYGFSRTYPFPIPFQDAKILGNCWQVGLIQV
jgi:hypothetical protein